MNNVRVSDIVFDTIQEKILSGEWKPGSKIMSEPQLVKELNVSRVSVREAIEKMVALNLLYKRQGGGTYVKLLQPSICLNNLSSMITLDNHNHLETIEFRAILEIESVKLCSQRCNLETISLIEQQYYHMIALIDDKENFIKEDLNFHMEIAKGSRNPLIAKVIVVLRGLTMLYEKLLYNSLYAERIIKEHRDILEAIKSRDSELASILMKRHIERDIERITNKPCTFVNER